MDLTISISERAATAIGRAAARAGIDVATYVGRIVDRESSRPDENGPARREVDETGMTEDEMADFIEDEIHAMRRERGERQA